MAVRKPLVKPNNVDVDALIEKGAKVKQEQNVEISKKWTNINLRIPVYMVDNMDIAVGNRVGITRTGWILESIHEKLKTLEIKE